MREILFKGKRVDNGEWVEGDFVSNKYILQGYRVERGFVVPYNTFEVISETVGQYTGLTDKNGKKIFEGDIVKVVGMFTTVNGLYEVIWSDASHCYCLQRNSYYYDFFTFSELNGFHEDCEVIGNIHDNKLEVEE